MNYEKISENIELQIEILFEELRSGISAREDSRAFGAMIEKRIRKIGVMSVPTLVIKLLIYRAEGQYLTLLVILKINYLALMLKPKILTQQDIQTVGYVQLAIFLNSLRMTKVFL